MYFIAAHHKQIYTVSGGIELLNINSGTASILLLIISPVRRGRARGRACAFCFRPCFYIYHLSYQQRCTYTPIINPFVNAAEVQILYEIFLRFFADDNIVFLRRTRTWVRVCERAGTKVDKVRKEILPRCWRRPPRVHSKTMIRRVRDCSKRFVIISHYLSRTVHQE